MITGITGRLPLKYQFSNSGGGFVFQHWVGEVEINALAAMYKYAFKSHIH